MAAVVPKFDSKKAHEMAALAGSTQNSRGEDRSAGYEGQGKPARDCSASRAGVPSGGGDQLTTEGCPGDPRTSCCEDSLLHIYRPLAPLKSTEGQERDKLLAAPLNAYLIQDLPANHEDPALKSPSPEHFFPMERFGLPPFPALLINQRHGCQKPAIQHWKSLDSSCHAPSAASCPSCGRRA